MDINNNTKLVRLDHLRQGEITEEFIQFAESKVVGQRGLIQTFAEIIERTLAGFCNHKKPAGSVFIAGPSGVGKTSVIKAFTEFLFDDENAMTRLEGQEFSESHAVSNLKGSPVGYVGSDEPPRVTQEGLDKWGYNQAVGYFYSRLFPEERELIQGKEAMLDEILEEIKTLKSEPKNKQDAAKIKSCVDHYKELRQELAEAGYPFYDVTGSRDKYASVFLIDELERAHKTLCNLLYTPLDEAYLPIKGYTAVNGTKIDRIRLNNTFMFVTSNIGHDAIRELLNINSGKSPGYKFHDSSVSKHASASKNVAQEVYLHCKKEAYAHFESSFLGRFDYFRVAQPLFRPEIRQVVDMKILELDKQLATEWKCKLFLDINEKAREFLVDESTDDPTIGARLVEKKIKRLLVDPLTSLKATEQIRKGDHLAVCLETPLDRPALVFYKKEHAKPKRLSVKKDVNSDDAKQ